jgi:hypothetical protein
MALTRDNNDFSKLLTELNSAAEALKTERRNTLGFEGAKKIENEIAKIQKQLGSWVRSEKNVEEVKEYINDVMQGFDFKQVQSAEAERFRQALAAATLFVPASERLTKILNDKESGDDPFNIVKYRTLAMANFSELRDITAQDIGEFLKLSEENAMQAHKFLKKNIGTGVFARNLREEFAKKPELISTFFNDDSDVNRAVRQAMVDTDFYKSKHLSPLMRKDLKSKLAPLIKARNENLKIKEQKDKFTRLQEVCESDTDPFNIKMKGAQNYEKISDVTMSDIKDFLLVPGNAKYAGAFFRRNFAAGLFSSNWRKEIGKNPELLHGLIIEGGSTVRQAMLKEELHMSSHLSEKTRNEMLVVMKLMGEKVPETLLTPEVYKAFAKRSTTDQGRIRLTNQLADHLVRCVVHADTKKADLKLFLENLQNPNLLGEFESVARVISTKDIKFLVSTVNSLLELNDPNANSLILKIASMRPVLSKEPGLIRDLTALTFKALQVKFAMQGQKFKHFQPYPTKPLVGDRDEPEKQPDERLKK